MVSEKRRMGGDRGGDDIVEVLRNHDDLSEPSIFRNKNWW
jgi:hypothetical protein